LRRTGSRGKAIRRRAFPLATAALAALLLWFPARAPAAPEENPEEKILAGVPLEDLSPRERERLLLAARKLIRIHGAVGDPGGGEVRAYLDAVEELARFLKRETIETRRRLLQEAWLLFRTVDRRWIDNAFRASVLNDAAPAEGTAARLADQTALLRRIGEILKEEASIPARQRVLENGAARRYRNLLRLASEGRNAFESIDHPGAQAALLPYAEEIGRRIAEDVRPAHDRQIDLLALHHRLQSGKGEARRKELLREFRTAASKVRAIRTRVDAAGDGD